MEALSFKNNYTQNQPSEVIKRLQSEENFTALDTEKIKQDTEKLKQDTVEIANKAKENTKENFIFRTLRNFGVNDPKKMVKSILLSVGTVIGVAILGNKLTMPATKLGNIVDNFLTGDNIVGKCRNTAVGALKKGWECIKKMPKPNFLEKFIRNVKNALKDPLKPVWTIFRGFENGAKGLFSNTITETIQNAIKLKDKDKVTQALGKIIKDEAKAAEMIENMGSMTNVKFADNLLEEIAKANGCMKNGKIDGTKLTEVLESLSKSGGDGGVFKNIKMKNGGLLAFMGDWWPANFINGIYNKITHKNLSGLQGNLGDSLIKYGAIRGKMSRTLPAKIIQIIPPLVGDQISNFVNDKSGMGILLCANLIGNFNKLQDAPKEKKVKTALNDAASGSLQWLVAMPIAYSAVYGVASLSKMPKEQGFLTGVARNIGSFFAVGLNNKQVTQGGLAGLLKKFANVTKGAFGGVMRFVLVGFVLHTFISGKIDNLCAKIFGKPYNPEEEAKAKELEEQRNTVIPQLGITQGEFQDKLEKNPAAIQRLQNDPKLVEAIDKNPKLMLDLLDGKEIDLNEVTKKTQSTTNSPMLEEMIKKQQNSTPTNKADLFGTKSNKEIQQEQTNEETKQKDSATYIPSSKFIAKTQPLSNEAQQEYNRLMTRSDKILAEAEKYI